MKRILALIILLLTALGGYSQLPEQVVRSYISTLNTFMESIDDADRNFKLEQSLAACGNRIRDEIFTNYKTEVDVPDANPANYVTVIYNVIKKQRYKRTKVSIACDLETKRSDGKTIVVAYLSYTGAIQKNTVTLFYVENGRITAMDCDIFKTEDWRHGKTPCTTPDPPKPTAPFSITSCTVKNWSQDGRTEYAPFNSGNTRVLWAYVNFSVQRAGSYSIQCKLITPVTTYSETKTMQLSSGPQSLYLDGFGSDIPGNHPAGSYRYEFYYNGSLLYTHRFTVPEGTPSISTGSRTFTVSGVTFTMKYVSGGTFQMGATSEQGRDADSDEKPAHSVTLSGYYIGETEVTQGLWKAVMGSNPSYFKKGDNYPVENVSWNDCQEFIKKLNQQTGKHFRLPTEAEWEYAARGGSKSNNYKCSGSNDINSVAVYRTNSYDLGISNPNYGTHPVKSKSPNELGLYDMSGNVYEWCNDWYKSDYYANSPSSNPQGPSSQSDRVLRGGGWAGYARFCRVSFRNGRTPSYGSSVYGLRLLLSSQ